MEILNQAMEFTQQYSLFFLAGMFAVILILVICMTVMNSRMKELQAAYDDFMRGNDGKSLEGILKTVVEDMAMLVKAFVKIASKYGMVLKPCAEREDLAKYGADCSGCMTVHTFETALHSRLEVPKRKKNQRNGECACLLGTDIGAYDTCGHLCKYCYANVNSVLVKENMRRRRRYISLYVCKRIKQKKGL